VIAATNLGQPVALNNRSNAGNAYHRIARRILGENVPLPSLEESSSLKDRFGKLFHAR
jgi:septum site-determining protein MinD